MLACGVWMCVGGLYLCCEIGACSNWPRGVRHPTSTFALELFDSSSSV